jgi:hypothetical protein
VNRRASEQAINLFGLAGVSTVKPVIAQDPQITRLRDRIFWRLRNGVGVGETRRDLRTREFLQLLSSEAENIEVESHLLQFGQFFDKSIVVSVGDLGRFVIGDAISLDLLGRQFGSDMHRHLFQAELACSLVARVADDDHTMLVQHQRLPKAEFADRLRHRFDSMIVFSRVLRLRFDVLDVAQFYVHCLAFPVDRFPFCVPWPPIIRQRVVDSFAAGCFYRHRTRQAFGTTSLP